MCGFLALCMDAILCSPAINLAARALPGKLVLGNMEGCAFVTCLIYKLCTAKQTL